MKNKVEIKNCVKRNIAKFPSFAKGFLRKYWYAMLIVSAFLLAGTIEYYDEVMQLEFNCTSATFAADNVFVCEDK